MKPKNKEVNIFNMSLLDILCGALGAFCFMMLVLFSYYNPETPESMQAKVDTAKLEEKVKELMKQMQNMSNLPPDVAERLKQMEKEFEGLRAQVSKLKDLLQTAQAQGEAYRRQADEAKQQLETTKKENEKLRVRNPVAVVAFTTTPGLDVDLYVKDQKMGAVDPDKTQGTAWPGDVYFNYNYSPRPELWLLRDMPAGTYEVYYKLLDRKGQSGPIPMAGHYLHGDTAVRLPEITMADDKQSYHVGSIIMNPDHTSRFVPDARYEADYQKQLETDRKQQAPPAKKN